MPFPQSRVVLVVEDDPAAREFYRLSLRGEGFEVVAVEDGLSALQVIEADPPDVVVLDMMLPRLGGKDVLRELRANPATRNLPILIVTGSDVSNLNERAMIPVLQKPVDADRLVTAVQALLSGRALN